jgi:DNA-binding GntR family transcriptional regulator
MGGSQADILNRRTASHAVAAQLRAEIQRGHLKPGTRLRQSEVAQRFAVSTTPVREAFASLQAQGLVRVDPHKGAIVFHPTTEDLMHLYEIREALESLAVRKALENLSPQRIDELQRLINKMRKAKDNQQWLRLNNEFHHRLYEASGSRRLTETIDNLRDNASSYIHMLLSHADGHTRPDDEHQDILDACRIGDVERAEKAVRAHMRNTVGGVVEFIEE